MTIQQLSIFVENKPGRMAEIARMIADEGIDIRALSLADTDSYGILRLIVDHPEAARKALQDRGLTLSLTDVLAVQMADHPGGFAEVLDVLSRGDINIEYMYAFIGQKSGSAVVILRVNDNAEAARLLSAGGIGLLTQQDLL